VSIRTIAAGIVGASAGVVLALSLLGGARSGAQTPGATPPTKLEQDVAALQAEVDRLKKVVPDQAYAMQDVDYHYTNLWFAGKAQNWPLADFYWKETISHLRWATRIIPVRKDSAGRDVNVQAILEAFEKSPGAELGEAIRKKDAGEFEAGYRRFLEACHACHTSTEKGFLVPRIPEETAAGMINFSPGASLPRQ
jgi:hypothetical protein